MLSSQRVSSSSIHMRVAASQTPRHSAKTLLDGPRRIEDDLITFPISPAKLRTPGDSSYLSSKGLYACSCTVFPILK